MSVDAKKLEGIPLFNDMDTDALDKVSRLMHYMTVQEGEILTQKGESAHTFYVILSGNFMISFDEGRAITIHEKGHIMGWSTVVTPFKYTGTAVALTRGEVLAMSRQHFQELLQSDARISDLLMKKLNAIVTERLPLVHGTKTAASD